MRRWRYCQQNDKKLGSVENSSGLSCFAGQGRRKSMHHHRGNRPFLLFQGLRPPMVYTLLSGPMVSTLIHSFPKKMVYALAFVAP